MNTSDSSRHDERGNSSGPQTGRSDMDMEWLVRVHKNDWLSLPQTERGIILDQCVAAVASSGTA